MDAAMTIDIEDLKRKAIACQAFHAAGCPVDDAHDTYPPDHYDAAVQPKYILALIARLEAAERDAARYRWVEPRLNVSAGILSVGLESRAAWFMQMEPADVDAKFLVEGPGPAIDAAIAKEKP